MQRWLAHQGLNGSLDANVNNLTRSYGCEGIVNDPPALDLKSSWKGGRLSAPPTW